MNLSAFLAELRRRKVFQVAAVYAAVGFVIAQAADIFIPGLNLPEWSLSFILLLLILGFPFAVGLAWVFDVTPQGVVRTDAASSPLASAVLEPPATPRRQALRVHEREDQAAIRSIAVLPFVNLSADPENEYFSDGLTEELLNLLSRLGELRVPARTSSFAFKGTSTDVREIGEKLAVEAVLEGSVRKAGNKLRITAQLVGVQDGYHLWSESYDRELEDIFAVQEEISRAIVAALGVRLSRREKHMLAARPTADVEAYDLYMQGLHHFHTFLQDYQEQRIRAALSCFERAQERDPKYAPAFAWWAVAMLHLADDFLPPREVYPRARVAAERALLLDPELVEAQAALGAAKGFHDWNLEGAEGTLKQALELNPSSALPYVYHSLFLSALGCHDEAVAQARRGLDLDPLSSYASWSLVVALWRAREPQRLITYARTRIELEPADAIAHLLLGLMYLDSGREEEGLGHIRTSVELSGEHQFFLAYLGYACARTGDADEARRIAARLEERQRTHYVPPSEIAYPYIGLGDLDAAFHWLDRAVDARDGMLIFLDVELVFDALRNDPRFAALRTRVGLR